MKQKLFTLIVSLFLAQGMAHAQFTMSQSGGYSIAWTGEGAPSDQELQTSAQASKDRSTMEAFVSANPNSPWAPGIRNALAGAYRQAGRNTLALNHWNAAWRELKNSTNSAAREEANHVLAAQLEVLSSLGRIDTMHDLLVAAQGRNISDGNDRRRIETATEAYSIMVDHPSLSYRCGTLALANIARVEGQSGAIIGALIEEPSTANGISLKRLVELSRQFSLGVVPVKRTDTSPVPVPSVIHWSQNHYGAVLEYRADINFYRVVDPTFRNDLWISAEDLNAEASGYFLVPENKRAANWPLVSDKECAGVFGRGYPYNINDALDRGCKIDATHPKTGCTTCSGMPVWSVSEPYINVWFSDEPWAYTTSRGEQIALHLTIKQRDSQGTLYTCARPGVQHNWYSRIFIQGMPDTVPFAEASSNWTATLFLPAGGQITYTKNNPYDESTKTRLDTTYGTPTDGTTYPSPSLNGYFNLSGFRVFYPDGSMDRYGLMSSEENTTTGYYQFEALWTSHTDPVGNTTTLGYTPYTNSFFAPGKTTYKLTEVTDYDGNVTTFSYYPSNPDVLYQVTSPYGQVATFTYDANTNLNSIVDAVLMTNLLKWDSQGRVTNLVTGYGTTSFNYYTNLIAGEGNIGGHNAVTRAVTVTDANGGTNLYAFRFDCSSFMGPQFASTNIPQSTPLGTLDTGTNSASTNYAAISFRNSFHWDPRQCASLSTLNVTNLSNTDFLKARMQHWLGDSNNVTVLDLLSVKQEPSPDGINGGQLTFYDYAGKTLDYLQGTNSQVAVVSMLQPSGQTEYSWFRYNASGFATNVVSTYTLADGVARTRTNVFVYGTNVESFILSYSLSAYFITTTGYGFALTLGNFPGTSTNDIFIPDVNGSLSGAYADYSGGSTAISAYTNANILLASTNASGGAVHYGGYATATNTTTVTYTLWFWDIGYDPSYGWANEPYPMTQTITRTYTYPLPTTITNEAGYVSLLTYNANNQRTSLRSPSGLTTTNIYNSSGFLTNSTDIEIGRTNSFTYTNGLVYTHQNELGLVTTNFWDKLQRSTGTADVTGTTSNVYQWLDVAAIKDRLGHWSYYGYDPLRNLIATTNANSEVRLAQYCQCGSLEYTRDAITNYTYYTYDLAGRLTNVLFPDGYSVSNTYNSLDQLILTSDSMGKVTNTYDLQGLLTRVADAAGLTVSNAYDIMDRPIAQTADRGVTSTMAYDTIGRLLTNMVIGEFTNVFAYSSNGLISSADAYNHLTLFTNDRAGRVVTRTNANQETNFFQYNAAGQITNLADGNGHLTYFYYDQFGRLTNRVANNSASVLQLAYDANGRVVTNWTPAFGAKTYIYDLVGRVRTNLYPADPPVIFTYDPNGRLTNLADATGTETLAYTQTGQLASEGGLWLNDTISFTYTNRLRSSLTLQQPVGSPWVQHYTNDAAKRLIAINNALGTFNYAYDATRAPLVTGINLPNAAFITNQYDTFARLTNTALANYWGHPLDGYGYSYNANSWRTGVSRYLGLTTNNATVGYDQIGQVTSWSAQEPGGALRLNEQLGFGYDAADNLFLRTNNAFVQTFTVDALNQLSNIVRSGNLTLSGNTPAPATGISVNGNPAQTNGDFTFAATNLSLAGGNNIFTNIATNVYGISSTNILTVNLPVTVLFQSDSNGNLISDGTRNFVYNAENRLTNVYVTNLWQSEFVYDGLGRRRVEKDFTWQSGSWVETNEIHYVYDGTAPIQERDINNHPQVTYTRGVDLNGIRGGLSGIGGLLARTDANGSSFYHCDGSGNITALIDLNQNVVARYEYDPFGKEIGQWGALASANRYRFSSKEFHALSGIYDYGVRYYEPNFQRWLNRDPSQENGGINLYGFVGNSAVNNLDPLGNTWYKPWTWGDDLVSPLSDLMTGAAEAQGVFSMNNQLANNGYVNMQDFLLSRKNFCGVVTAGNMDAVNAARHIATGATMLYLNTAQMIATAGISTPETAFTDEVLETAAEETIEASKNATTLGETTYNVTFGSTGSAILDSLGLESAQITDLSVTIRPGLTGSELASTIAHEGFHVAVAQNLPNFAASAGRLPYIGAFPLYAEEVAAYGYGAISVGQYGQALLAPVSAFGSLSAGQTISVIGTGAAAGSLWYYGHQ